MEYGVIEREMFVEATPEIVYEVVSRPEHLRQWWPDEAAYEPQAGAHGSISFGDTVVGFAVVEARPPSTFSFRWTQPVGEPAVEGNSLVVTFELTPSGRGTLLKMTERGFREMGWASDVLREQYESHISGWDFYLPRLAPYVATVQVPS